MVASRRKNRILSPGNLLVPKAKPAIELMATTKAQVSRETRTLFRSQAQIGQDPVNSLVQLASVGRAGKNSGGTLIVIDCSLNEPDTIQ